MAVKQHAPGLNSRICSNFKKVILYIWKWSNDKWEQTSRSIKGSVKLLLKKKSVSIFLVQDILYIKLYFILFSRLIWPLYKMTKVALFFTIHVSNALDRKNLNTNTLLRFSHYDLQGPQRTFKLQISLKKKLLLKVLETQFL